MWAFGMDCAIGKSGSVVEWNFRVDPPEPDMICVGVMAREKMSELWTAVLLVYSWR